MRHKRVSALKFIPSPDKREGKVVICSAYRMCEAPNMECWHKDAHLFDRCHQRLDCEWCGTVCKCTLYESLAVIKEGKMTEESRSRVRRVAIQKGEGFPEFEEEKITIGDHDCFQTSKVIGCDGKNDIRKCNICGKQWEEPCTFDEDYS